MMTPMVKYYSSVLLTMEYQQKKENILQDVEYNNLLTFSLTENKLERNFKALVEALMLSESRSNALGSALTAIKEQQVTDVASINEKIHSINDALQRLASSAKSNPSVDIENMRSDETPPQKGFNNSQRRRQNESSNFDGVNKAEFDDFCRLKEQEEAKIKAQIQQIKEKLLGNQVMEDSISSMQREINALKGEVLTLRTGSYKSIRRESIAIKEERRVSDKQNGPLTRAERASIKSKNGKEIAGTNGNLSNGNSNQNIGSIQKEANSKDNVGGLCDGAGEGLNEVCNQQGQNGNGGEAFKDRNEDAIEERLHLMQVEINTLKLCCEELRQHLMEAKKKNLKISNAQADISSLVKKLEASRMEDNQNLEKRLKDLQFSQLETLSDAQQKPNSPEKTPDKGAPLGDNYKNEINDKFSKLKGMIQNLVSEGQFKSFRKETRDRLDSLQAVNTKLQNEVYQELKKIGQELKRKSQEMNSVNSKIQDIYNKLIEAGSQCDRKNNIALARIEELKKGLQNLREDIQFYQSMSNGEKEKEKEDRPISRTQEVPSEEEKQRVKDKGDDHKAEDLKRWMTNKLQDQRAHLMGLIRELERKLNSRQSNDQQIVEIWDKLGELNLFMGKKADQDDTKKNLLYLQKKIQKINALLMKADDNTEDARIARSNWFCLSCDHNLQTYQGKIGRHLVWDNMPLKGINKPNYQRKGLPILKK